MGALQIDAALSVRQGHQPRPPWLVCLPNKIGGGNLKCTSIRILLQ